MSTQYLYGVKLMRSLKKHGIDAHIVSFPSGERHKTLKTFEKLTEECFRKKLDRSSVIIGLGGGVVGDIAGFVAATYMRGVRYINVPTTLLSMVDSSIGGKVGIDTKYGKNTVGSFWPPRAVVMDIQYLAKMSRANIVNGLIEAMKTFMTSDKESLLLKILV